MTTTVTVEACCNPDTTQVQIDTISASPDEFEGGRVAVVRTEFMQNGDKRIMHVFDNRSVRVLEVPKT